MVRAKKIYGQHFLQNKQALLKIIDSFSKEEEWKRLIEIGPGMGALTDVLVEKFLNKQIILVELDSDLIPELNSKYGKQAQILHLNILKAGDDVFACPDGVAVAGNFPYNISGPILFKILDNREYIVEVVGMFQKEVADRVRAAEGSRQRGILSVLIQCYFELKEVLKLKPGSFNPPPKVDSSVLHFVKRNEPLIDPKNLESFKGLVKLAFSQRRKTLRNSLKALNKKIPEPFENKRAEQLSNEEFVKLFHLLN